MAQPSLLEELACPGRLVGGQGASAFSSARAVRPARGVLRAGVAVKLATRLRRDFRGQA